MKKFNVVLLLFILALSLFASPMTLLADEGDQVVATVNGVAISKEEFHATLEAQYGSYALQELVQNEIIRQRADALGVTFDGDAFAEMYEPSLLNRWRARFTNVLDAKQCDRRSLYWPVAVEYALGDLARAEVEVPEGAVEAFSRKTAPAMMSQKQWK